MHPLMRDDKTLKQCVKHLVDDTKLCVRFLEVEEQVTTKDVVIVVRLWRPLEEGGDGSGVLDQGEDVVVRKHATVGELKQAILKVFQITRGGVVSSPLYLTRSFLASANSRDLKKKMLTGCDGGHSTSMLRWCELPGGGEGESETGMAASDVGGLAKPLVLAADAVVMSTEIGGLRDGSILFMHQGNDLKNAIAKWTAPVVAEEEDGGEGGEGGASGGGKGRSASLRRNKQWKSGSIAASSRSGGVFGGRRGKEVGIQIRTQFDDPVVAKNGESEGTEGAALLETSAVVAGGCGMKAARLLSGDK